MSLVASIGVSKLYAKFFGLDSIMDVEPGGGILST